jgi:hypothetical protein
MNQKNKVFTTTIPSQQRSYSQAAAGGLQDDPLPPMNNFG